MAHPVDPKAAPKLVNRDKEMIPRVLIRAMFILALSTVVMVAYARLTDRPLVGQPLPAPVTEDRQIVLTKGEGLFTVTEPDGEVIATFDDARAGFISVVYAGLARTRTRAGVSPTEPLTLAAYENGRLSLTDPATNWHVELGSFGASNRAAFAKLLD